MSRKQASANRCGILKLKKKREMNTVIPRHIRNVLYKEKVNALTILQTDRAAELVTLNNEMQCLKKRILDADAAGKKTLEKQIAQINRDIKRNQEQIQVIL